MNIGSLGEWLVLYKLDHGWSLFLWQDDIDENWEWFQGPPQDVDASYEKVEYETVRSLYVAGYITPKGTFEDMAISKKGRLAHLENYV